VPDRDIDKRRNAAPPRGGPTEGLRTRFLPCHLDSRPGIDLALTVCIVPGAEDRAVGAQAKSVSGTRRHRDDVAPIAEIALPLAVVSGGKDSPGGRDPTEW